MAGGTGGPFSKGKELVEFVYNAHGGAVRDQPISRGAVNIVCHKELLHHTIRALTERFCKN
jgi:hypothetical protein